MGWDRDGEIHDNGVGMGKIHGDGDNLFYNNFYLHFYSNKKFTRS